uniref:Uncharacterized protein n=1 Tax=Anguilla anguilla TaxID=7936 RepID=A0A0E9PNR1_ANGAN
MGFIQRSALAYRNSFHLRLVTKNPAGSPFI